MHRCILNKCIDVIFMESSLYKNLKTRMCTGILRVSHWMQLASLAPIGPTLH